MPISEAFYSRRSEDWETPAELFDGFNQEFHFSLDPCATVFNAKCKTFFTKKQNGLLQDWSSHRVFLNPPYGKDIAKWMEKARAEAPRGALVICLVHARTDTKWWHSHVQGIADEIRFLKGRVKFTRPGRAASPAPFPSAVVIYRPRLSRPHLLSSSSVQPLRWWELTT